MTLTRAEMEAAAAKAFDGRDLAPDGGTSWDLIAEMGSLALCVPEARGGLGAGRDARVVIHRALGRALVRGGVIAQMMVIDALSGAARTDDGDALLKAAMAGERMTASLAHDFDGDVLTAVPDADKASHVLVLTGERVALFPATGYDMTSQETWDETRRLFDVRLSGDAGLVLAEGTAARDLSERIRADLLLALAADSLGGAEAALAMTVDYLGTRRQFDRPLAMFQSLKHRCADLRVNIGLAEALLWQEASEPASLARSGAAKAMACRIFKKTAEEAIQLHGGVGLTVEHPCHLFLKRAFLNAALGGDANHWEERAGRTRFAELLDQVINSA